MRLRQQNDHCVNHLRRSSQYDDKPFKGASAKIFENARGLRKTSTVAEDLLWQELRNRKINGLKFRRQHPLSNYLADFYGSEKQLVIEVEGAVHHSREAREYDEERTNDLVSIGIHVLRFTNDEVEKDISSVPHRIRHAVTDKNKKSSPL